MIRSILLAACLLLGSAQAAHNPAVEHDAGAYQSEWWRLTASMADKDGRPWQLEWALYRQHSSLQNTAGTPQFGKMSLAHVAITTPDGQHLEQRFDDGDFVQAGGASSIILPGDERTMGWKWVSKGASLFPARLSFSVGDRDLNLLLESVGQPNAGDEQPASTAIEHVSSEPLLRVRGFVDRGASKTYLRGQGRLDHEWQTPALAGNPAIED